MNPKVDFFFKKPGQWQEEYKTLRKITLDAGLTEELKWGCPCYTNEGSNVVVIHGFKNYCALLFFKGALMKDPKNILIQQTENVQAARQARFTGADEIGKLAPIIKAYIKEAIAIDKKGLKVELKETSEFKIADEFRDALKEMPDLKKAFYKLTPGRQRQYLLHFSSPKQVKTRQSRVDNAVDPILNGKGLND